MTPPRTPRTLRARGRVSVPEAHRRWLALVDRDGPFLAVPPLVRVYASGMPPLSEAARQVLRDAKPAFDRAWDAWHEAALDEAACAPGVTRLAPARDGAAPHAPGPEAPAPTLAAYRAARDTWVRIVLTEVLSWGERYAEAADAPPELVRRCTAHSPDGRRTAAPTGLLRAGERVGALVLVVDPVDSLRDPLADGWTASPIDRMEGMLRAAQAGPDQEACTIGLVTDGRWWAVVSVAPGTMVASGVVDAQTWTEEPATRDAFAELLGVRRLLGGKSEERLPALFADSVLAAEEITEALGVQVRRAVELLVTAFSEAGVRAREAGAPDPLPEDAGLVYDAAVTMMMRVVFLLFAQERDLLPQGALFEAGYGLMGVLDDLEARALSEGAEPMDATRLTWHRLLATSRALAAGAAFEDVRLPAYGGSLFDDARFPFLTATTGSGALAVTVSDRVMLHVLRAVQVAHVGKQARRVSFRDIDVEQIGYIYEGLLGYTARRAEEIILGLPGRDGEEPEVPLEVLDDLAEEHADDDSLAAAILAWVKDHQPSANPPTPAALAKALTAGDSMEDAERSLLAVSRDKGVRDRLRPWVGAIRRDLRNRPYVVLPGGLYVAETPSRRNAGAHYTPRALAEEVVRHALEPLVFRPGPYQTPDSSAWRRLAPSDILALKVADIACGSGAFLVAAARYLADHLMEAWEQDGIAERFLASGHGPQELENRALREVVAHCLYGVDINPMAVEMCKLSLWLVSLDPRLPFSFVDDKILTGNSLLGITDIRQLEELHIDPAAASATPMFSLDDRGAMVVLTDLHERLECVAERRRELTIPVVEDDPQRSTNAKRQTLRRNDADLEIPRLLADAVIAAGLGAGGGPGRARTEAYEALREAVGRAYPADGSGRPDMLRAIVDRGLTPFVPTDYEHWRCLHWPLELPDVMEHGGFDAIVGNPPFLGAKKLSPAVGQNLREWCVSVLASETKGNADLVAYFFLRAFSILRPTGTLGLVATNTVAQGDTRQVGLDQMVKQGLTITRAVQSQKWPAQTAHLEYAAVWGTRGAVPDNVPRVCDGVQVRCISTLLEPLGSVEGVPERLRENSSIAFIGCCVLGKGFILDPEEARSWIDEDPRNADVLFPYLNGDDLNSRPDASASRWAVDFNERDQSEASRYVRPWAHVLRHVYPERAQKDAAKYPRMVNDWWKYWNGRPAMRKAIKGFREVLIITRHSSPVMLSRISVGPVMSDATVVFASDSYVFQAVLSSSLHQIWVVKYGSGMRNDPRYTPTDVFETFPRPHLTEASEQVLDAIGRTLDEDRREIMLRRQLGLTALYNKVNDPALPDSADPDVARLRVIHRELDEAVMAAYGWDDVPLDHGFHIYRKMTRWTISPAARVEVLDRLLALNHERAAAEAAQPSSAATSARRPTPRRRRGTA